MKRRTGIPRCRHAQSVKAMDGLAWQLAQNRTAKDYPFAGGLVPLLEANAAALARSSGRYL